jgi:triacylglycerol lipase
MNHRGTKRADDCCATRWPLLFVHGLGFHDSSRYRYWGRVPETLIEHGARIHYGFQDSWGTCASNARALRVALLDTVAQMGCEKVNIIGHSKGGLDARVLASLEDCAPHIASITTIASPHAGSRTMDALMRIPAPLFKAAAVPVNGIFRLMGDTAPDFYTVCAQLTTAAMRGFNEDHPVADSLFCQSYAVVMNRASDDAVMALPYLVVRHFDGPNDGLVALASAPFGEFKGVIGSAIPCDAAEHGISERGISHTDVIDLKRRPLKTRGQHAEHGDETDAEDAEGAKDAGYASDTGDAEGMEHVPSTGDMAHAPETGNTESAENVDDTESTDDASFDIVDWYIQLVADLKARGL